MTNPYYSPEAFGLTTITTIDFSDGCYQFDYLTVWRDGEGRLYYAEDSGCSCPSPFEDFGLPELTRVQNPLEIVSRMEYRAESAYEKERVRADVAAFKARVMQGEFGPKPKVRAPKRLTKEITDRLRICPDEHGGEWNSATVYGHHGSSRNCIRVGDAWVFAIENKEN